MQRNRGRKYLKERSRNPSCPTGKEKGAIGCVKSFKTSWIF